MRNRVHSAARLAAVSLALVAAPLTFSFSTTPQDFLAGAALAATQAPAKVIKPGVKTSNPGPKASTQPPKAVTQPPKTAAQPPKSSIRLSKGLCFWEDADWSDLNSVEQQTWTILGWSEQSWDSEDKTTYPATNDEDWDDLTPDQQTAAKKLGYDPNTWDNFDESSC